MKTNIISRAIACCFSIILITSCESNVNDEKEAFENYKAAKNQLTENVNTSIDSNKIVEEKIIQPEKKVILKKESSSIKTDKNIVVKQNDTQNEWLSFKVEMKKKINENENKIKAIKSNPKTNRKNNRRIRLLEKDENSLRSRMNEYNGIAKPEWENFKTKMNEDANDLAIELNAMALSSIK